MQFSTVALSPGLCSEEGYNAGVTVFLSVVTENREDRCGAVREKPQGSQQPPWVTRISRQVRKFQDAGGPWFCF